MINQMKSLHPPRNSGNGRNNLQRPHPFPLEELVEWKGSNEDGNMHCSYPSQTYDGPCIIHDCDNRVHKSIKKCQIVCGKCESDYWEGLQTKEYIPTNYGRPRLHPRNMLPMCDSHHALYHCHYFFIRYMPEAKSYISVNVVPGKSCLNRLHGRLCRLDPSMNNAPHPNLLLRHENICRSNWIWPTKESFQIFHLLTIPYWPLILEFPGSMRNSDPISNLINFTLANSQTVTIQTSDRVYKYVGEPRNRNGRHGWFIVEESLSRDFGKLERWKEESVREDWETGSVKRIVSGYLERLKELEDGGSWFEDTVVSGEDGSARPDMDIVAKLLLPIQLQRTQEWLDDLPPPSTASKKRLNPLE